MNIILIGYLHKKSETSSDFSKIPDFLKMPGNTKTAVPLGILMPLVILLVQFIVWTGCSPQESYIQHSGQKELRGEFTGEFSDQITDSGLEVVRSSDKYLEVSEDGLFLNVDTGKLQFRFDRGENATLRDLRMGEKWLVRDNANPLLSARLLESEDYDEFSDHASGKLLDASYEVHSIRHEINGETFSLFLQGTLSFEGGDSFPFSVVLHAKAGSQHLGVDLDFEREGHFQHRYLRELSLDLPLALNHRKRIAQGGDDGITYDTRYFYQFHVGMGRELMMEPNRMRHPEPNYWTHFSVDQKTPGHFRIWRAESDNNASLILLRGRQAAGWTSLYDQQGGALIAIPQMAERAPKSLRVDASNGGTARAQIYPSTRPALSVDDDQANTVFGSAHRIDWIFYLGEMPNAQPDRKLADLWGKNHLPSDPKARRMEADIPDLWSAPATNGDIAPLVSGGIPIPRGELRYPEAVAVLNQDRSHPLQASPLAWWPDGSIKWLHLTFPLSEIEAQVVSRAPRSTGQVPFDVTLREGDNKNFVLHYGGNTTPAAPAHILQTSEDQNGIQIDNGPFQVRLGTGTDFLRSIRLNGRELLTTGGDLPQGFVDFLRTEETYLVNDRHAVGRLDPGVLDIEEIEVQESGPMRAIVRLHGYAQSKEPTLVTLWLEFQTGRPLIRVLHSAVFLQSDPRDTYLHRMGLHLPLAGGPAEQVMTGGHDEEGVHAITGAPLTGLRGNSQFSTQIWQQEDGSPRILQEEERSPGWLARSSQSGGTLVAMRHMWQEFPKEILSRNDGNNGLTAYFWPESTPVMDVRRYSNYPHRSQGETVSGGNDWVSGHYYKNDPFLGTSRSHEMLWYFFDGPGGDGEQLAALNADFQSPPLIYAGADWYRETEITYPTPDYKNFPLVADNLTNVTDFFLYHQEKWGWYGMWDYGDVQHRFRAGYGWNLPPDYLLKYLRMEPEDRPGGGELDSDDLILDYIPQHDWAFDNGRWGWTNTEGLPNLHLQNEYFRTGRRDIFFAAEALARHTRDVVIRHDGQWFGSGTRHGVQHWSDGHHHDRQTIQTEVRFHYFLTGEHRTRELLERLVNDVYMQGSTGSGNNAHTSRLYGMLFLWEITGDPELGEKVRRYARALSLPEGIATRQVLTFPGPERRGEPIGVNSDNFMFHSFGAMYALLEYYYLTEDPQVRESLVGLGTAIGDGDPGSLPVRLKALAFALRHSHNPEPLRKTLQEWVNFDHGRDLYQIVSKDRRHWSGDTAFLPGMVRTLTQINSIPYLLSVLDEEPTLTEEAEKVLADREKNGEYNPKFRLSWQDQFDRPEFDEYLGRWRPWNRE